MSSRLSLIFILIVTSAFIASCGKPKDNKFNVQFENLTDKGVNIIVYASQSDYNNDHSPLFKGHAAVRGYYTLSLDNFTKGKTYWVDWYSDDTLYSNWYWARITVVDTFSPSQDNYEFKIDHFQASDNSRLIWMNGFNHQTTWKAVDAYTNTGGSYNSVWSTLGAAQQNVQLTVNKDYSAKLSSGVFGDTALSYTAYLDMTVSPYVNRLSLNNADNSTFASIISNWSTSSLSFNGDRTVMLAYINSLGYYFAMVRQ